MSEKKKLLLLIDRIEGGGAEKVLIQLANYLKPDYEIFIIPNYAPQKENLERFNLEELKLISPQFSDFGSPTTVTKAVTLIRFFRFVYIQQKIIDPVLTLSFLERSNIVNVICSKLNNRKCLLSVRNNLVFQYKDRNVIERFLAYQLIRISYNRSDGVIALSKAIEKQMIASFKVRPAKLKLIYNPYNLREIRNSTLLYSQNPPPDCITIGRLSPQKGHNLLIKAFRSVVDIHPEVTLHIYGEGELKKDLKQLISNLKLENNVFLKGYVKNPYPLLKHAKVFVFSSIFEGFGNALIEAMACGTAVISTNCPHGPQEILDKDLGKIDYNPFYVAKYGILTSPLLDRKEKSDEVAVKSLADAINFTLKKHECRENLAQLAKLRSEDFSHNKILNEWKSFLQQVLYT